MAKADSSSSAESAFHTVFVDTSLDTHLAMIFSDEDTVADFKQKILVEHAHCFPIIGEITIQALKVRHKSCFYHLPDSMLLKSPFIGEKRSWFLYADVSEKASIPDSSLLPRLGRGDFLNQVVPRENLTSPGYVCGEAVNGVNTGVKLSTDNLDSHSSERNKGKESEVLEQHNLNGDQDGIPKINTRCKKDKSKKRTREMPCEDIAGKAPQSGDKSKKQRTNEEKVEDSCDHVKVQTEKNVSGTSVSGKDTSKLERTPEKSMNDLEQMVTVGGSKAKKSKKHQVRAGSPILSSEEVWHDHVNNIRDIIDKDGVLDVEDIVTISIGKTEKEKALGLNEAEIDGDGIDSSHFLGVSSISEAGNPTNEKIKKIKKIKATSGLKHADNAEKNIPLRPESAEAFGDIPGNETGKEYNNLSQTEITEFSKIKNVSSGIDDTGASMNDEMKMKQMNLINNGNQKLVSLNGTNFETNSVDHNEADMKIKDVVGISNQLDDSHVEELAPRAKRKEKSKKNRIFDTKSLVLAAEDHAGDVCLGRSAPDKAVDNDHPGNATNGEHILSRNEKTEVSSVKVDGCGGDNIGTSNQLDASHTEEVAPSAKRKEKSKKKKRSDAKSQGLAAEDHAGEADKAFDNDHPGGATNRECILSRNEKTEVSRIKDDGCGVDNVGTSNQLDASHIEEVALRVKRKEKSKKKKPSDAKSLAAEDHTGDVLLRSEPYEAFDNDHPGDATIRECILSRNEKTEMSLIKDYGSDGDNIRTNLDYKLGREEGLAQKGAGRMFSGETKSKCKSMGQDEKELRLKDVFGSANPLDASGLLEGQEVADKRRKKSKRKKDSDTKSCLQGDHSADEITKEVTILSQGERKLSTIEGDGSVKDYVDINLIQKTEGVLVEKGDLEAVLLEQCEAAGNIKDRAVSKSFNDSIAVEAIDSSDTRRKKSKKAKHPDVKSNFFASGMEQHAHGAGDVNPLVSESDKTLAGNIPGNGIDTKDAQVSEHDDDYLPLTQLARFQESTDISDGKVKSKTIKSLASISDTFLDQKQQVGSTGDPVFSTEDNVEDEISLSKKSRKSRAKRTLSQLSHVMPEGGNHQLSGDNGSPLMSSAITEFDMEQRHLVNNSRDGAKDGMEVPNSNSDKINFLDYFVSKNDEQKGVSSFENPREEIQHKESDEEMKAHKKNKKKPHVGTSDNFPFQGSKDEQSKLAYQKENTSERVKTATFHDHQKPEFLADMAVTSSEAIDVAHASLSRTYPGVKTNVSIKEENESWDSSSSSMESKEEKVHKINGSKFKTLSRGYHVAMRKSYGKEMGKGLSSSRIEKSLIDTSKTIFSESSAESSEDGTVSNSDCSTKTPDNSSSSDDSEEENGGTPGSLLSGFGGQRESGGKSVSKSQSAAGRKNISLDNILRSSQSYKKAKLTASQSQPEDGESQLDFVPDSLA